MGRKWTLLGQSKAFIENDGCAMKASQMHSTVFRALKRFERFPFLGFLQHFFLFSLITFASFLHMISEKGLLGYSET